MNGYCDDDDNNDEAGGDAEIMVRKIWTKTTHILYKTTWRNDKVYNHGDLL